MVSLQIFISQTKDRLPSVALPAPSVLFKYQKMIKPLWNVGLRCFLKVPERSTKLKEGVLTVFLMDDDCYSFQDLKLSWSNEAMCVGAWTSILLLLAALFLCPHNPTIRTGSAKLKRIARISSFSNSHFWKRSPDFWASLASSSVLRLSATLTKSCSCFIQSESPTSGSSPCPCWPRNAFSWLG